LRKDGTIIDAELSASVIQYRGKPTDVGIIRDITARKQAEEALRESEGRFRSAFDDGAVAMALTAPDLRLLRVNAAYCRLLGFDESELVGHTVLEFTHPDDARPTQSALDSVVKDKNPTLRFEKRYIGKDGRLIWVDVSSAPVCDAQGDTLYLVTHVQDITERKRAEEALQATNEELARFNRAMVGRELRMIELKKEVNQLCEQASQPPRYPLDFVKGEV
jgi:PAS domain S-box-containing protein